MPVFLLKKAPVFRLYFYKNELVWRISHTEKDIDHIIKALKISCQKCVQDFFKFSHTTHIQSFSQIWRNNPTESQDLE